MGDSKGNIIDRLHAGIHLFAERCCQYNSDYVQQVTKGQTAKVLVIGCSDSLMDPNTLMGADLGELFVHRNIAALVPPYESDDFHHYHGTSAVLEYAIRALQVEHIIVFGHGNCGGMKALRLGTLPYGNSDQSFLWQWLNMVAGVKQETGTAMEQEAIKLSLSNLRTFPWVAEAEAEGKVKLHGWHFDRGILSIYESKNNAFVVDEPSSKNNVRSLM